MAGGMEIFKLVGRVTMEGVEKIERGLTTMGQGVEKANKKLKELGEKTKEIGEGMKTAGEGMTTKLTAPLLALGGLAAAAANDYDKAMGLIDARTDRTAQETAQLQQAAADLWKNAYGEDASEAAEAISTVDANLGNLVENTAEVKNLTEKAFILRDAFGYDIQESTRAAGQLMQQFGISGNDAFDMITTAAQRGGDFSGELLDTISEYSTQFANMGFTGAQMMNLFVEGASSGIFSLDKLADATKESFLQITDGADNTKAAIGAIGLDYGKVTNDIQAGGDKANAAFGAVMTALSKLPEGAKKNALAIELIGTPLEDLGPQFQSFFANTGQELQNFSGSTAKAGDDLYNNFGSKLTSMFRGLQSDLMPLGGVLIDVISPAIDKVGTAAGKAAKWFQGLSDWQQNLVIYGGLAAAALGPLIVMIGSIVGAIGTIVTAVGAIGLVTVGWIAGIVALVAILALAYAKLDWFRNGVNKIFGIIAGYVKPIIADLVNFFRTKIAEMQAWWAQNGAMITQAFHNVFSVIVAIIKVALAIVMPIVMGFIDGIKNIISGGLTFLTNLITFFAALFTGQWGKMWDSLKGMVMGALQLIWGLFEAGLLGRVFGIIKGFVGGAGGMFSSFFTKIGGFFTGFGSKAKGIFTDTLDTIVLKAMYGFDKVKSVIMAPINFVVGFIKEQLGKIAGFFERLNIKFPKIKLPHFSIKGEFSLKPPSVPHLGVDWYKKGGVFGSPSVIGVGEEPGVSEAVIPLKKSVLAMIGEGIAAAGGGQGGGSVTVISPIYLGNKHIDTFIKELAPGMNEQLKVIERRNNRQAGR